MDFLNDGIAFGVSSLGCPLIAIDLDENPITGRTPGHIKELLLEIIRLDKNQNRTIEEIDETIKSHIRILTSNEYQRRNELPIYLSYLTSLIHEVRHYHDLISSTTGFTNLFFSLAQYFNTPSIFYPILNYHNTGEITNITLPFDISSIPSNNFPEIRRQEFEYYFKRAKKNDAGKYNKWKLDCPKLSSATLETLYETSAVNYQMGFAYDLLEKEGQDIIMDLFQSTDRGNQYLKGIRLLQELKLSNSNDFTIDSFHLCLLTWYALNGGKPEEKDFVDAPSPIVLWELLLTEYSIKELNRLPIEQLIAFCNRIFHEWNLKDYKETSAAWDNVINEMYSKLESEIKIVDIGYSIHKSGLSDFQKILNDRKEIHRLIEKDFNLFFNPQTYGWGVLSGKYPLPTIVLKCDDKITLLNGSDIEDFNVLNEFFFWEIIHNLLVKGRGSSCAYLENYVFNMFKNEGFTFWMN